MFKNAREYEFSERRLNNLNDSLSRDNSDM